MNRPLIALCALAALLATAAADDPPRPRLIDFNPWAWLPSNRNRSPSIMDYFFPPSRTPKQSNLEPPADRTPPQTTTLENTPAPTTIEERSTTYAKKISTKTKSTAPVTNPTATTPPKTKKSTRKPTTTTEAKTTQTKTDAPTQTMKYKDATATTYRPPTKHYTIRPVVRTTETPTVQDTETTLNSDSTESLSDIDTSGTTADGPKDTVPTLSTSEDVRSTDPGTASTAAVDSTTDSTAEPADSREGYLPLRDKPQQTHVKINEQTKKETVPLPAGSTSVLAKPTKYHYYPHNQHIYLLPECAIQQVCNAVYVRLNYTQPLCACPARYRDPCSASLNADDLHTTRLTTDSKKKYASKAVTLVKTCEAVSEMRECRAPRDWSLLALQNIRTGKSHYLVICRCPEDHILEGPMSHDQPTYASVPGIRVYGMMCVRPTTAYHSPYNKNRFTSGLNVQSTTGAYKVDYSQPHSYPDKQPVYNRYHSHSYTDPYYNRRSRVARVRRSPSDYPPFPWYKVIELAKSLHWID
ncbi:doublesex cognate 73A [Anticarsia gemmatalis]|uniref:doublesex cognate 73A n=1 Tax=Anticarsia gemmatalis TaxID=129554 RepID=UPI003F762452